jgi:uncharacterized protein (DUF362 family)
MKSIIIKNCQREDNLKSVINEAVMELGGFSKFINIGDKVLIKPNINTADPAPASSDPDFIKAVTELVVTAGASQVIIGDSSTFYQNTIHNFEKLNLFELEKIDPIVKVVSFDKGKWVKKNIDGQFLKSISVPEILNRVDKIIFLPCLKTHYIAKFTGALKLGVGLMKPKERLALHAAHTEEKIADLNLAFKPDLIIMDGRKCFIAGGPTKGELRRPDLILASTSRVAIDLAEVKIIQSFPGNSLENINVEDLVQIKRAKEIGIS